ncbi:MAG: 2-oxoacid:acceptor oxidoreductase subunit alpha [Methanolinea sp.]|nr:2-oxoacid:acceptor oxidoreductase subunit alpha [Methanolinea sp.]
MVETSVLIGGKAGDGINIAGMVVAHLFNRLGYRVYMYFDYPSLIKGGHNFAIIRAAEGKIGTHRGKVDFILALNQDSVEFHKDLITADTVVVYDSGRVQTDGIGVPIQEVLKEEGAPPVMGNSCIIGAFARAAGMDWSVLEEVFKKQVPKALDQNLRVARRGYNAAVEKKRIKPLMHDTLPVISGNEAIGLGLIHGGLDTYVAYPMTPTSNLLHFLAGVAEEHEITVFHPENEIGVMLMALGSAYAGKKTAVGTSGGGFCLMTEGFSLSGMSEIPVVVVLGQRTGPSTGLPTYTAQSDLHFAIHAGQGEFPRLVVAPGDAEQAFSWSSAALRLAWRCQVPAIILGDKTFCEGIYSFNAAEAIVPEIGPPFQGVPGPEYHRYRITENGISPLLSPPSKDAVIKVNSYAHDEAGITTEQADLVASMTEKRERKGNFLRREVNALPSVNVEGISGDGNTLICWGSTLGVCREVAADLGLCLVQPVVLEPLPVEALHQALMGAGKIIVVEENMYGQLELLLARNGIRVHGRVRRYDGRPFPLEELAARVREVLA